MARFNGLNSILTDGKNCQYQKAADSKRPVAIYRLTSTKASDLAGCQQSCESERSFICQSLAFSTSTQDCYLSDMDTKMIPSAQLLESAAGVDFYERTCQGDQNTPANPYVPNQPPTSIPNARPNGLTPGSNPDICLLVTYSSFKFHLVKTDCRYDGVRIKVSFTQQTSGAIFPKNKFSTCGSEFKQVDFVVLDIAFPNSTNAGQKDCDGVKIVKKF